MTTYTFTITDATYPVTTTFTATTDADAITMAKKLQRVWKAPKAAGALKRHPSNEVTQYVSKTNACATSWKKHDPQGPHTNVPICLNGIWFTPNGGRIHNIVAYRNRCIESAARIPVPAV